MAVTNTGFGINELKKIIEIKYANIADIIEALENSEKVVSIKSCSDLENVLRNNGKIETLGTFKIDSSGLDKVKLGFKAGKEENALDMVTGALDNALSSFNNLLSGSDVANIKIPGAKSTSDLQDKITKVLLNTGALLDASSPDSFPVDIYREFLTIYPNIPSIDIRSFSGLKLTFKYGMDYKFSGKEEVYDKIQMLVKEFAPSLYVNSNGYGVAEMDNFPTLHKVFKTMVQNKDNLLNLNVGPDGAATSIKDMIKEFSSASKQVKKYNKRIEAIDDDIAELTKKGTTSGKIDTGLFGSGGIKINVVDGALDAASQEAVNARKEELKEDIVDQSTVSAINSLAYIPSTINKAIAKTEAFNYRVYFFKMMGLVIYGPFIVTEAEWEFNSKSLDSEGYPTSGTFEFRGLKSLLPGNLSIGFYK